jgi:nucleoside-diphosphate-sugar epimerase
MLMPTPPPPTRVLITGANGLIGSLAYKRLAAQPERYAAFGLARRAQPSRRAAGLEGFAIPSGSLRLADLTDFAAVRQAVEGIEVVVHLAADPNGGSAWESIHDNNIVATYHVFEASRQAGVRRVIFTSTNQVVFGYRADEPYHTLLSGRMDELDPGEIRPIRHTDPTRPLNYYACSKVFGEALAHMYAYTHGMSCLVLRIGWVTPGDNLPHPSARALWCSQRDCLQMIERAILAPADLRYDVFFVQSANPYNLVDIQHARDVLGYEPQDQAEDQEKRMGLG